MMKFCLLFLAIVCFAMTYAESDPEGAGYERGFGGGFERGGFRGLTFSCLRASIFEQFITSWSWKDLFDWYSLQTYFIRKNRHDKKNLQKNILFWILLFITELYFFQEDLKEVMEEVEDLKEGLEVEDLKEGMEDSEDEDHHGKSWYSLNSLERRI